MIVLFREVSDEVSQSGFHRSEIDFTPISADSISVFLIIEKNYTNGEKYLRSNNGLFSHLC